MFYVDGAVVRSDVRTLESVVGHVDLPRDGKRGRVPMLSFNICQHLI